MTRLLHVRNWISPTLVVVLVCLAYVSGVLITAEGDPFAFVLLGTRFSQGNPQGSEGYDGQFAYQIALRPLEAAPYLDVPAYRYQRLLYPVLARILALGQPELIPWTLIAANILAIGLGTWATGHLLQHLGVSRWYALVYGLYGGNMLALRTDLNEPLAQGLVQLAMLAWARKRRTWAVVTFGLAALAKETMLIFLAAYILYHVMRREWSRAIGLGMGVVPFAAYQLVLWLWLGSFGVGSGGAGATPFSLVPLGGLLTLAQVNLIALLLISLVVVPISVFPALVGIGLSLRDMLRGTYHPLIACLLLNGLVILFLPASTFREPAAMLRLTQGLVASMLLYGALSRSSRILNYSLLWIVTNVLLLKGVVGI